MDTTDVKEIIRLAQTLADSAPYLFFVCVIILLIILGFSIGNNRTRIESIVRFIDAISDSIRDSEQVIAELKATNSELRTIIERGEQSSDRARAEIDYAESAINTAEAYNQSAIDLIQRIRERNNLDTDRH